MHELLDRQFRMRSAAVSLSFVLTLACRGEKSRGPVIVRVDTTGTRSPGADSTRPSTTLAAGIGSTCPAATGRADTLAELRSTEEASLACWSTHARRVGDTLILAKGGNGEVRFVNSALDGESRVEYTFSGAILRRYWVIALQGYESGHTLLVDVVSGEQAHFVAPPVPAPNGRYLAAATRSLQIAEGATRLEIWRVTEGAPLPEFSLDPFNPGKPDEGWGPGEVTWRTSDTLLVPRYRPAKDGRAEDVLRDTVRIVRGGTGWCLP